MKRRRTPNARAKAIARDRAWQRRERVHVRKAIARGILWWHVGGGCDLLTKSAFCCDDEFENLKTGARVVLATTRAAHHNMPSELRSLGQVTRKIGVKVTRREPGELVKNWWKIPEGRGCLP